jgi:hypothetical protein
MMKVLMVFYASVAISVLVVEDGLRVIQGVAKLMMICRLCMLFDAGPIAAFWGNPIRGDQPDLHNQSCLTFIPPIIVTTSCMLVSFFFSRMVVFSQVQTS